MKGLRHMDTVIALFLGAGASKPFGFPLTREILPIIRDRLSARSLFTTFPDSAVCLDDLSRLLLALLPGFNDVTDLPLITDILSLVDYSLLTSTNPLRGCSSEDLRRLRLLLEQAIYDALWWPYPKGVPPPVLSRLSSGLLNLIESGESLGIISTNYDIAVETEIARAWSYNPLRFDFGFSWRDPRSGNRIERSSEASLSFYKLHGSVNWLRCELCEHIYINLKGVIAYHGYSSAPTEANTCHCGHTTLRPVLIAPSLVRDVREVNLLEIWKHSLELLRQAHEWVIIGYSFPSEDIAVRSLFLRASHGRSRPPRITVVQKGDDPSLVSRYRTFFPTCEFFNDGLEGYLDELEKRTLTA